MRKQSPQTQLRAIRKELKRHMSVCQRETIIGAIRNLAQAYVSWRERAIDADKEIDRLNDEISSLNSTVRFLRAK